MLKLVINCIKLGCPQHQHTPGNSGHSIDLWSRLWLLHFTIPPCLCNTIYQSFICTRLFAHGELPVALCLLMGLFSPYSCHWKKDCLLNRETILHLEADWLQLLFTAIAFIWWGLSTVNNRCDLPIQSSFTRQYRCATKVKFNFNLHYLLFIWVPCIKGLSCYWQNAFFPRSLCSGCILVYYVSSVCLCDNIIFISNFKWKFQLYYMMLTIWNSSRITEIGDSLIEADPTSLLSKTSPRRQFFCISDLKHWLGGCGQRSPI